MICKKGCTNLKKDGDWMMGEAINPANIALSQRLDENIQRINQIFQDCDDVVKKEIYIGDGTFRIYLVYVDSMADRGFIEGNVLKNLMFELKDIPSQGSYAYVKNCGLSTADVKDATTMSDVIYNVLSGNTAVFVQESDKVMIISSKDFPSRGVDEAESEVVVRGSKESFNESLRVSTVLIRRRIRDTRLKVKQAVVGRRSKTDIALMYMEDLVRPEVLAEIRHRLERIDIDGILDSGVVEQLAEKAWYSPFPQFQTTERPDKAAASILEGRIVLVVDNSPMVLLLPTTFNCFFQAADDYYNRWGIVCFTRLLRYMASFIAIAFPGAYIAVTSFHPEILPTSLALSFAASREGVPFPLAVEVLIMELAFELLREAGIRLPGPMGSTLGIVGGLIIGQAAVDANIVSPIVVIVVSLTALAAFTIPNEGFASAFRLLKFYLIALSAFLGLPGFVLGLITVLIHLAGLESFGIPYLMPFVAVTVDENSDMQDGWIRFPWFKMKERPIFTQKNHRRRMKM